MGWFSDLGDACVATLFLFVFIGIPLLVGYGALWAVNVFGFQISITWTTIIAAAVVLLVLKWIF